MTIRACFGALNLFLFATVAVAQTAPNTAARPREPLSNMDRRAVAAIVAVPPGIAAVPVQDAGAQALAALVRAVPGARVDRDAITGAPSFVRTTSGFLTGPASGAGPGAAPAQIDPRQRVMAFIDDHSALFGHRSDVLAQAQIRRDYITRRTGLRTVVWEQRLDDISVFGATLQTHLTARGEVVNISSHLVPNLEAAAPRSAGARVALVGAPPITARDAVAIAARNLGEQLTAVQVSPQGLPQGAEKRQRFQAPLLTDGEVRQVWLPTSATALRLGWEVVCSSVPRGEMFRVIVDGETGETLVRHSLTEYISNASYRVFTSDSPSPFSPGLSTPGSTQPPLIARTLVTTPALSTTASPNGWINDGVVETQGNNVDAHTDINADNLPDLPRPQAVGVGRVFDPALDLTQAPSTYRDAAVVNLFYWCNWMHDQLYDLGFDEAAGNFQVNNFGRGGLGNDAVQADAQDGSGTDNANFSTPPDGSPGRMQMYLFTGPTPARDGDFDAEIILHEYTHGLSNRLVGGGVGMTALVSRAMGEGWSDFYGLTLLSEPGDDVNGNYAAGAYATYQLGGLTQNYYFGIRRYPYTTALAKNPLTFRDTDPSQASAHTGIPRSPIIGTQADEVHNAGEVWCVTLWDARANLINRYGFAIGNRLILQLVTDGMKLAPANPNFLQARDAILQADLVATGGANRAQLWSAFAKRGMGANATAPVSSTTVGLVENYDLPDDLGVGSIAPLLASGMIGGPFTPASANYTLTNTGAAPLAWTATKTAGWFDLAPTGGTLAPGASTTVTATLNATANALTIGLYSTTIAFANTTSGFTQTRPVQLDVQPITVSIVAEDFESGTLDPARWTISGTSTFRTQNTTANGPHAGTHHLTMDSSLDGNYARNEATLTLNLAGQTGVFLKFWAKMFDDEPDGPPPSPFVGGADFDGVAISADGTNWYEVQSLRAPMIANTWAQFTVDLDAALAAHGLSYNSTFKIRFNHFDNYGIATDGIAIDDIAVLRVVTNRLSFTLPATIAENAAPVTATIAASPVPTANLTVALTSSLPGQLGVPASVTIPAGQASATFQLTPVNDTLLNGTRNVTITGNATTWSPAAGAVALLDNETAVLSVTLPASATEGATGLTGTVSVSAAPAVNVVVQLSSSDPISVVPPTNVTIPAGQTSVTFSLGVPDDNRINGTRTATVTATVANWTTGQAAMTVFDNETTALALTVPANVREGDIDATGTVRISGTLASNLTIALTSDNTAKLVVPATVTILAGQTSASFVVAINDNTITDGAQTVHLGATATGFTAATATVTVADNDVHHFAVSTISSPQPRNAPFTVTITAQDVNGLPITNYNSTVALVATSGAGGSVPITPTAASGFVNGGWTGPITATSFATGVVLTASDGNGHTGSSNAFDVAIGPLHHFAWSVIASPQLINVPFSVVLTAQDAGNNTVPFNGTANLGANPPSTVEMLSWVTYADLSTGGQGEYYNAKQAISTFFTNYHDTSTTTTDPATLAAQLVGKHVFFVPEQENVSPGVLGPIGTSWTTVLNNFVNGGGTVIVCSWQLDEHLLLANSGLMAATKGSAPSSLSVTKGVDTPLNVGVTTPFLGSYISTYTGTNGTTSLQSAVDGNPVVFSRNIGAGRAIMIGTDYFTLGTDMDRIIANAVSTAVTTGTTSVPLIPATATFTGGVWSGTVAVPITGVGLKLSATSGTATGLSNAITVTAPPTITVTLPTPLREGDAPKTATITLSSTLATNLTVNLSSSDTTAATVPATITIPAGQTSANFTLTIVDDTIADGPQPIIITASASGLTTGTATGVVLDNDAHHFSFATIASPQVSNGPIPVIITARDAANAVMADYNSILTLTATGASGPLAVTPATTGAFVNGVWNGSVQINALTTNVVITASDGQGHTGASNGFTLATGSLSSFAWNTIASPQTLDTPFAVTVRAVDSGGTTVPAYNGVANFSVLYGAPNPPIGTDTFILYIPLNTYAHDSRTEIIYPASEMSGAGRITALAFQIDSATNETLTNFTLRLKHTTASNFDGVGSFDNSGWTTVYRANPVVSAAGWMTFTFTTPFDYDGVNNLMIDVSFDRTSSNFTNTFVRGLAGLPATRMLGATSNSTDGDPLTWTTSPAPGGYYGRPNITFSTVKELPIRPSQTTAFTNGVWTGQVSVPVTGTGLALRARAGTLVGTSNTLDVAASPTSPTGGATIFAEDFESGVFSSAWAITGTGNFRTQITTANGPHAGTQHMTMDQALDTGVYARNEATVTLNLAGRTGGQLTFWAKIFNDEPDGPPPSPFPSTGADFDGVAISADGGANWYEVQALRTNGTPPISNSWAQFTVNLDAALAAHGLSYSSNFKIRFNQYDNFAIPTDGICIDDILVTANPLAGFNFAIPAQATEGAGALTGTVTLDAVRATDAVITLGSSAPAKLTVPASVTVPAGQLTANFTFNVLDDTIVDGNRTVAITGKLADLPARAATIVIIDNDVGGLVLTVPATTVEGAGTISGTVRLTTPVAGNVTVALTSSDPTAATVPTSVTFSIGQTSAAFPITVIDDNKIDGPQTTTITAAVSGWTPATAVLTVNDNETATLSLNLGGSLYEGTTASGSVSISGTFASPLVVNLVSATPARVSVPASVTIPVGSTGASFSLTAVDNTLTDGSQNITVTATASGFTTAAGSVTVLDDDVHHFSFSPTISNQTTSVPFGVNITARDVGNVVIATFNGTTTLTAAGDGGAVTVTPTSLTPFYSGTWTGNVTIAQAGTNVRLTATSGAATGASNPFNVTLAPTIAVSPSSIVLSTLVGSTATRTLTLSNTGGGPVVWSIPNAASLAAHTAAAIAGPVFTGAGPVVQDKAKARSPAPDAGYTAPRVVAPLGPDGPRNSTGVVSSVAPPSLATVLANLNVNNGLVRSAIPNRFAFFEGVTGNNISDGGNDMYDGGNFIGASISPGVALNYSDNAIVASALLGTGGQYFTRKYDGLFVFAADVSGLSYFEITGNLGADGGGSTDTAVLSMTYNGTLYRGFVKRVYNAFDPSVNHLIIVPDNGTVTHEASTNTDNDYHRVTSLAGITRIYHVLYAGTAGAYIDNTAAQAIMSAFLDAIATPDWITPNPTSGTIASGATQNVTLTIGSASLAAGNYARTIFVNSNDPANPQVPVPINLTVSDLPSLKITPTTGFTSSGFRAGPFTPASQIYTLNNPGLSPINWTAAKSAAWFDLSATGGTLAAGATTTVVVSLNATAAALAHGAYADTITFTNTTNGIGNATRSVALTVNPAGDLTVTPATNFVADGLAGGPFTPTSATWTLTNTGDATLAWTASKNQSWFSLSATGGNLAPGATATVTASINAAAAALPIGAYHDAVLLTNTTTGRGTITRSADLFVRPLAPVLAAEPPVTGGVSNTISWAAVTGATEYEVQAANNAGFTGAITSGWIGGTSFTFATLADGQMWYFRVRARQAIAGVTGSWSQTSQIEFDTGTKSNVSTTTTGEVVLATNSSVTTRILNPSFEADPILSTSASNWTTTHSGPVQVEINNYPYAPPLPTAGTQFVILWTYWTSHVAGEYVRISQNVNFTGLTSLVFDATLTNAPSIPWANAIRGDVRIDGTTVWSSSVQGPAVNQSIDVTAWTGTHTLELSCNTTGPDSVGSQWVCFDNLRAVGTVGYLSSGTLTSPLIAPTPLAKWGTLQFTKDVTAAGTALTVDVLDAAGALLAADVASGTDLSGITAVAGQPSLKLRANLSTTQITNTPRLLDWTVGYSNSLPYSVESAWSAAVSSLQDATPPVMVVTSSGGPAVSPYTITGTAADAGGISAITVNGIAATTSDSFAHWSASVPLVSGNNVLALVATDRAVPANVTTASFNVTAAVAPTIGTPPANLTVNAGQSATFTVVASGLPTPSFQWRKNGNVISGATTASLAFASAQPTDNGAYTVVVSNFAGSASATATLTVNPIAPVFAAGLPTTATAVQGRNFFFPVAINNTSATFSATGLAGPGGTLAVSPYNGSLSGAPANLGTFSITITATNTTGSASFTLSLTVQAPPPVITSPAATSGHVGAAFSFNVVGTNSPTNYAATNLPAGLNINPTSGLISGTPTVAGTFTVTITTSNASGSITQPLVITIDPSLTAPTFTGGTNLSGVQGTPFTFTPAFGGGPFTAPFTVSGLPTGVTLTSATAGTISGTPTVTGIFSVIITATNAGGSTAVTFTLTINAAPTAPVITSASTAPAARVGTAFTFTLTSSGTPAATSYSATGLPAGLTLNAANGAITGTPTVFGLFDVAVRATNTVGTGPTSVLSISVAPSASAPVITSIPVASGQVGQAFSYTLTGSNSPTSFQVTSGTLPAGLVLNAVTGAITGTPLTAALGETRVWFNATSGTGGSAVSGLSLEVLFTIAPAAATPIVNSNGTATGQVGQPFQYAITASSGTAITGYGATGRPAWLALDAVTGFLSGIPSEATTTPIAISLTATNSGGTGNAKILLLTVVPAPATPVITSALTASGRVGTAFTYQISASETPTSFVAVGLPAGLSLNATTGAITGTPTIANSFDVVLRAANAGGLGAPSTLTISIAPAVAAPAITSAASAAGQVGVAFSYQIVATNTPILSYGFTGILPVGLALNTSTGAITGTPADDPRVYTVQLTAANAGGTSLPQPLTINLAPALGVPALTTPLYAAGEVGVNFSFTITATNLTGSAPYAPPISLDAVNLPGGLAVNPATGVIQGKPTTVGTTVATLTATNAAGTSPTRDLTIAVQPALAGPVVSAGTAVGQVGQPFGYLIIASNSPISYEALGAPAWMTLNGATGAITGTPTVPGNFTVQLVASNAAGASSPATLGLTIYPAANTPVVTSSRTQTGAVGTPMSFTVVVAPASPAPSFVATGLPGGLSLNASTGVISGTPTISGTFNVLVTPSNSNGVGAPVTIVVTILPNVTFGP